MLGPKEAIRLDGSTGSGSTGGSSHNGETSETDRNSDHLVSSKPGESEASDDDEEGVKCIKCDKLFADIFTWDFNTKFLVKLIKKHFEIVGQNVEN